jgi:hypothetical protein
MTNTFGVRSYLVRAFTTFDSSSPFAAMAADTTSPNRDRAEPVSDAKRHGQVRLWFGAHVANSQSWAMVSSGTSRERSTNMFVRRDRMTSSTG